tara:strand:- start:52 stop:756 length:705 start_codon:yes stop_codon:yes gene_type:complete
MSYLAEVEMPIVEKLDDNVEEENNSHSDNEDIVNLDEEEVAVAEEKVTLPSPAEKMPKIKSSDIFKIKSPPAIKPIIDPVSPSNEIHGDEKIIPKAGKPEKKKRVLSEKQLAALKKGREARALKKKSLEDNTSSPSLATPPPAKPTLVEAVEAVEPESSVDSLKTPQPKVVTSKMFTQEELSEAVLKGVTAYDTMRKNRKEKKKKDQAIQRHEQKVFTDINKALNDPYANCFSF